MITVYFIGALFTFGFVSGVYASLDLRGRPIRAIIVLMGVTFLWPLFWVAALVDWHRTQRQGRYV